MQKAQKKRIKYLLFFVAYDWDVHNQIEFYTSQCARSSDFDLTTIGLYCNGSNPYLNHTCELLKQVKPLDQAHVCSNCQQSKLINSLIFSILTRICSSIKVLILTMIRKNWLMNLRL